MAGPIDSPESGPLESTPHEPNGNLVVTMLNALKRRILKAAFAEQHDRDIVHTAAWYAADRLVAALHPFPSDEARADAAYAALVAMEEGIKRYQALRAGPPDPPTPAKETRTPRRPLRERGQTLLTRMAKRLRMAARILFGHRPATVGYDALDRRIAENCAFWIADTIAARYAVPQPTIDEDDDICRKIAWLVYEAIEAYVTYSAESEAHTREQLACEEALRRTGEPERPTDLPF